MISSGFACPVVIVDQETPGCEIKVNRCDALNCAERFLDIVAAALFLLRRGLFTLSLPGTLCM